MSRPSALDQTTLRESTVRLTASQAIVEYLKAQFTEQDGVRRRAVAGVFGIFGHGNVCGLGQGLEELGGEDLPYYQAKNEQSMVHAAIGYAKAANRLSTLACSASIGPGSTNMITGAATATINRVPVLLFPADTFANRRQGPVLQQLEHPVEADLSVSDCFRPVSVFFDRITRAEQLLAALPKAMRVLFDPAQTGAVTITLHQDVQGEAFDVPTKFLEPHTWTVPRRPPATEELLAAADVISAAQRPIVIAGGGVRYAAASLELGTFSQNFGVPVAETFAGKSSTPSNELLLGGLGVTGTRAAFEVAQDADVVICVGTRLADFTTGSHSVFQDQDVRFVGINVCAPDAYKLGATSLVADAKLALGALTSELAQRQWRTTEAYRADVRKRIEDWQRDLEADLQPRDGEAMSQGQLLRTLNECTQPDDVVVAAAGSPPSDILRMWDPSRAASCFLEFGYSCMGHEIPAGLGFRMASPGEGEVYVVIGDGTYLMASSELVTAVQENVNITVIVVDNHGYQCIRGLQLDRTGAEFGNEFRAREHDRGRLTGDWLPIDYASNARSFGCKVLEADDTEQLRDALEAARRETGPIVIVSRVEPYRTVIGSECWWDLGVPEVSSNPSTQDALARHRSGATLQRFYG